MNLESRIDKSGQDGQTAKPVSQNMLQNENQSGALRRLSSGPANHQTSSMVVRTVATTAITTTAPNGSSAIGDMTRPAKGG